VDGFLREVTIKGSNMFKQWEMGGILFSLIGVVIVSAMGAGADPIYPSPFNVSDIGALVPGVRILGDLAGDRAGSVVAGAGDVDGDGRPDLLVAAYLASPGGRTNAGQVYLIYGSMFAGSGVLDLQNAVGAITRFDGVSANDNLGGFSGGVSGIDDCNGDGYDDIILGAPMSSNTSVNGAAYLILGKIGGLGLNFNLVSLNGTNGVRLDGITTQSYFGGACSGIGDTNADGLPDLIVSAMWEEPAGRTSAGESFVLFGATTLPGSAGVLSAGSITPGQGVQIPGIDSGDHSGACVSGVGDVNGDGVPDSVITAPRGAPQGRTDAGEAYLIYGSTSGIGSGGALDLSTLNGSNGTRIECRAAGDSYDGTYIGLYCSAAGDVNGDSYADFLIGAEFADSQGMTSSGEAYLIYGSSSGVGSGGVLDLNSLNGVNGVRIEGERANDTAMRWMAGLGDINGDGLADFALGNPQFDSGFSDGGKVYIIYGSPSIGTGGVFRVADINGTTGAVAMGSPSILTRWGASLSGIGDANGDGVDDFILGSGTADPNGRVDAGEAYVIFGSTSLSLASYKSFAKTGLAYNQWVGIPGDGKMAWGSSRAQIGFADGTGVGTAGSSLQTVTLYRSRSGITNFGNGSSMDIANVCWQISTDRTGWTSGQVTFRYMDSEITGMDESSLRLYQAPALSGPWTLIATQSVNANKNQITGTVSSMGYFAIRDTGIIGPDVTVEQSIGQSDPTNALPISFTVTFSEPVAGFDASDVNMSGTATGVIFSVTGSGTIFTISVTSVVGDGTLVPSIAAGRCTDLIGNPNTTSTSTDNSVTLDRVKPTASLNSSAPDPTRISPIPVSVSFSKPVTGFTDAGLTVSNAAVSGFTGSGQNYTFNLVPSGQGSVLVQVNADTGTDAAGNGNLASSILTRQFDSVPPTITMSTTASEPTNTSPIPVTVQFSESVNGFIESDIAIVNGMINDFSGSGNLYTFNLVPDGQGVVTATIGVGVVTDLAGNDNSTGVTLTRTFDSVRPTVSMMSPVSDPGNIQPIPISVVFSKSVTDFEAGDVVVTNASMIAFSGSGKNYSFSLIPAGQGSVISSIPQDAAHDDAGNGSEAGYFSRVFDTVPPNISLASITPPDTNVAPIPVTITFAEPVIGFIIDDISVNNGILENFSGNGAEYAVEVMPAGQGVLTVSIAGGVAVDFAGNPNLESAQLVRMYDNIAPTGSMTSAEPNPTNTTVPIPVTIEFSENVFDFVSTDLVVVGGLISDFSGSGRNYAFNLALVEEGLVSVDIPAGAASDIAGNGNHAISFSRTYDRTRPGLTISSTVPNLTNASPIPVTFTFSEPVEGFDVSDISLLNGTPGTLSGTDSVYTLSVFPASQGLVTVSVLPDVANDAAGNGNSAAVPLSRTYDGYGPTLTMESTAPDPTNMTPIVIAVTFSEEVQDFEAGDIVPLNATVQNFTGSGVNYDFELVPSGQGVMTANVASGVAHDAAGNGNEAATQFQRMFDSVRPTLAMTSTAPDPTNTSPVPVEVVFSEPVVDFSDAHIQPTNAVVADFSGSDASYSFNLYPAGNGPVMATVAENLVHDSAGNANAGPVAITRMYDSDRPSITLSSSVPDPTNLASFSVTAAFNKPVTGFELGDINVINGSAANLVGTGESYAFDVLPSVDGFVTVNVPENSVVDLAGNANTGSAPFTRQCDSQPPSVLSIERMDPDPTNEDRVSFIITFSEPVRDLDENDLDLAITGLLENMTVASIGVVDSTSNVMVDTGQGDGTLRLDVLDFDTVLDMAGNPLGGAGVDNGMYTAGPSYTIDRTDPSVTLTSATASPTNQPFVWISVDFSEPVNGLEASAFSVVNGAVGYFTGMGAHYSLKLMFVGQGESIVMLPALSAQDMAGNGNSASPPFTVTFDTISPTFSISSPVLDPTNMAMIPVTVDFSEPVLGFQESDILLENANVHDFAGSGLQYTFNLCPVVQGWAGFSIEEGVAADSAGNMSTGTGEFGRTYDSIPPAITISLPSVVETSSGPVTFVASYEGAQEIWLDAADIELVTAGVVSVDIAIETLTPETRLITLYNVSGNGSFQIMVKSGTAMDAAGNFADSAGPSEPVTVTPRVPLGWLPVFIVLFILGYGLVRVSWDGNRSAENIKK